MHLVSPKKVFKGNNVWPSSISDIVKIAKSPLFVGRSERTRSLRKILIADLKQNNLNVVSSEIKYDCCFEDLENLKQLALTNNCDSIIAAGGGKVLDSGKFLAHSLSLPCITIPLSASTCAGWTALANIYSAKGKFIKDVSLSSCPEILIYDHSFIQSAPRKTLTSGIADSLAKWYESSVTSSNNSDGIIQQAIQISRVLRDQLFINGEEAYNNPSSSNISWRNVIEANGLTAGLVGGIGGAKCRTAAAHALHNAITQLEPMNKPLHGEIVGVGILIQLRLEEFKNNNKLADQSIKQLEKFMKNLNLPTTISELGINVFEKDNLQKIAEFTCRKESEIHYLPFSVSSNDIEKVISEFEKQKIII
tara:strand:+ start:27296 stop:28387 length:1092 start_codon:yes stop_codon:yes gene_type:complete